MLTPSQLLPFHASAHSNQCIINVCAGAVHETGHALYEQGRNLVGGRLERGGEGGEGRNLMSHRRERRAG